jgi:photosystem II stability/assembly factor-like uncharacterized protein
MAVFSIDIAMDVREEGVILIGTKSGVFRSWNRALSWHPLELPDCESAVLSISISSGVSGEVLIVAGTEAGELLSSNNLGDTWSLSQLNWDLGEVVKVLIFEGVNSSHVAFAVFSFGVLVSYDGGTTWQQANGYLEPLKDISIVSASASDCADQSTAVLMGYSDGSTFLAHLERVMDIGPQGSLSDGASGRQRR